MLLINHLYLQSYCLCHSVYLCILLFLQLKYIPSYSPHHASERRVWYVVARGPCQRYTYRVLQTIQMKLILLCVWADQAVLGSSKTALKFKYEI